MSKSTHLYPTTYRLCICIYSIKIPEVINKNPEIRKKKLNKNRFDSLF